jgi:hypothetical protein
MLCFTTWEARMDYKAPEAVEQCDDDSSQWELRLSQLQLMELSAAQLEADGGQCPAAILN